MDRLAALLRLLTLLALVAGLGCFYLAYRPAAEGWGETLRLFLPGALASPWVVGCAAAALATALAARLLGRLSPVERRSRSVHTIEPRRPEATHPEAAAPPTVDEIRLRLEPYLRRKPNVPAFVDDMLSSALTARASDVHIQPLDVATRVSFRVGGELREVATVPQAHHDLVVRRLKVLADLVTYETARPQDGRFTVDCRAGTADVRISVLPTHHGEKVVLRLARGLEDLIGLDRLGMMPPLRERFEALLAEPQGLVIFTGPTGSGKTTTLYAALRQVHEHRGGTVQIATLEDPIEVELPFLSQTQVDQARGLGFAESLRSVLRQDPNVLMVGEIRDAETAHVAIQAGLTGHLILTSLHAESSPGVFSRLIDMGVEPFLASSATLAVISQRLVRRLCPDCRHPARPSKTAVESLRRHAIAAQDLSFFRAEGCQACGGSGHRGRLAIFELLRLTPELRRLVAARSPTERLAEAAVAEGMVPLAKAAAAAAAAGEISLEEALRVVG